MCHLSINVKLLCFIYLVITCQAGYKSLELVKNCWWPAIVLEIVILDHFSMVRGGIALGAEI